MGSIPVGGAKKGHLLCKCPFLAPPTPNPSARKRGWVRICAVERVMLACKRQGKENAFGVFSEIRSAGTGEIRLRRMKYLPTSKCEIFCFAKCEGKKVIEALRLQSLFNFIEKGKRNF